MPRDIELRSAKREHYQFALDLYLSGMRDYTQALMVWDEGRQRDSFAEQWVLDEVRIIACNGEVIGWLQVAELPAEFYLKQFFIAPEHQRHGIGGHVLAQCQDEWREGGKPASLAVLKNNPARHLYERARFVVTGEAGVKYVMRWSP